MTSVILVVKVHTHKLLHVFLGNDTKWFIKKNLDSKAGTVCFFSMDINFIGWLSRFMNVCVCVCNFVETSVFSFSKKN